ncbi:hypothetical protein ASPCADRAFT_210529 [Aspergillus carbonarius ITEM 5010]|uniref:Uncharacterized protein n=1 Tax=Aspergillus carbonarius (strain ITEM 5010) TaxID=602072 RepID=A0A1R3RCD9_ASPC5|nr:hypothetical protein ASPCADRAFT_210529 [Aspergillus carbonarius ITEM 5010]
MAVHTLRLRRAISSASATKTRSLQITRSILQLQVLVHLFRVAISLALLPLDNTILLGAYAARCLPIGLLSDSKSGTRRRQAALRDSHFQPKTVLVTGIDTPYGLAVARGWFYEGHRVIGVEVGEGMTGVPCGASMSRVLAGYYRLSRKGYVGQVVDVVVKEGVDVWVPCCEWEEEDAAAKGVVEARTECKCVTLDRGMVELIADREAFMRFLVEKGLPVVERHEVVSRDAVHKILHRSPTKVWNMRRSDDREVMLPKRTLSLTYSEVSEIRISRERPWTLQQQTRLGSFFAEMVVVRGHVKASKIYPADEQGGWGQSPMDRGLATAIQALLDRFASQVGPRLTGHMRLKLMVDEEMAASYLRYVIHIDSCVHGAAAVRYLLLEEAPGSLVAGYLGVLTPQTNGVAEVNVTGEVSVKADISTPPRKGFSLYRTVKKCNVKRMFPVFKGVDRALQEGSKLLFFWKNQKFSKLDPMPWWWHAHIYQPLKELEMIVKPKTA